MASSYSDLITSGLSLGVRLEHVTQGHSTPHVFPLNGLLELDAERLPKPRRTKRQMGVGIGQHHRIATLPGSMVHSRSERDRIGMKFSADREPSLRQSARTIESRGCKDRPSRTNFR